ncbi:MAG: DUF4421 family protein [Flavobacteriales bacterium]|nr:DUF4421 family protein [Flavobacteriales bacterium]
MRRSILHAAIVLLPFLGAHGQSTTHDTDYVTDLSRRFTLRFYVSHKFNGLRLLAQGDAPDLIYRPNGNINIGLGASIRKFTLNIGVRIPGLNQDDDRKGKTRFLDTQAYVYGAQQATSIFLQVFKGYHLIRRNPLELGWAGSTEFPYRPDLLQYTIGASSLHMLNHRRFSYRAAYNQDAIQKRSQGTMLVGGYLTAYVLQADSSIVPAREAAAFPERARLHRAGFYDLGPLIGYAYTLVTGKRFFLTGSAAAGNGLGVQVTAHGTQGGQARSVVVGPGWHAQFRAALGYNSRTRYVGFVYSQEYVGYIDRTQRTLAWNVGVVRLVMAQRLQRGPRSIERGARWLQRRAREVTP